MLSLKQFISQKTSRAIVMSEDKYVYFDTLEVVSNEIITECEKELALAEELELQAQANSEAIQTLNSTDWKVIRELERLMLAGTELNAEREALREAVK